MNTRGFEREEKSPENEPGKKQECVSPEKQSAGGKPNRGGVSRIDHQDPA